MFSDSITPRRLVPSRHIGNGIVVIGLTAAFINVLDPLLLLDHTALRRVT